MKRKVQSRRRKLIHIELAGLQRLRLAHTKSEKRNQISSINLLSLLFLLLFYIFFCTSKNFDDPKSIGSFNCLFLFFIYLSPFASRLMRNCEVSRKEISN